MNADDGQICSEPVVQTLCPHDPLCDWQSPDRRKDHMEWHQNVDRRLDDGAATMKALREELAENTTATKKAQADAEHTKNSTKELVSLLESFKGAFRVLEMIGKLARPLGYIAALVAAVLGIVSVIKGGPPP